MWFRFVLFFFICTYLRFFDLFWFFIENWLFDYLRFIWLVIFLLLLRFYSLFWLLLRLFNLLWFSIVFNTYLWSFWFLRFLIFVFIVFIVFGLFWYFRLIFLFIFIFFSFFRFVFRIVFFWLNNLRIGFINFWFLDWLSWCSLKNWRCHCWFWLFNLLIFLSRNWILFVI